MHRLAAAMAVCLIASACRLASAQQLAPRSGKSAPAEAAGPEANQPKGDAANGRLLALIAGLDDERFAVRRKCELDLIAIGSAALPAVESAALEGSAETRIRVGRIVEAIHRRYLLAGFSALALQPDEKLDLEHGMWLISRIANPDCRREDLSRQLDALAERVRQRLGSGVVPRSADPQALIAALRQVLFVEEGFTGNTAEYTNPDNSSLERVLTTRKGLPIQLSHVVVAVGQRLDAPIVGLSIPGRYMVKYDGAHAPPGYPSDDIVLDPFNAGRVLTVDELQSVVAEMGHVFDPEQHLAPSRRRASLERMLNNLIAHLVIAGREQEAGRAVECLALIDDGVDEP